MGRHDCMKSGIRSTITRGLLLAAMLMPPAAVASPPGFDLHLQNALKAITTNDLPLAEKEVAAAEKTLNGAKPADETAGLLLHRGLIHVAAGRPKEGIAVYTQSINILIKAFGTKDAVRLCPSYSVRSIAYFKSEAYKEAAEDLAKAFALMQPDEKKQPPPYLNILVTMVAPIRIKLGGGPLIVPMLTNCEAAMERCGLGKTVDAGAVTLMLGDTYRYEGKTQEAEAKFRKAIETFAGAKADEAELTARLTLASQYYLDARFADADEQFKPALEIANRVFGIKSAQAARVLQRQGHMYADWNKLEEGEAKLKKAIAVLEKDPNNPELMGAWIGLSSIAVARDDLSEAENAMKQAFAIAEKSTQLLPEDRASAYQSMANILMVRSKYVEAEAVLQKSLELAKKSAEESPLVAECYSSLGELNFAQGKYKEADEFNQKSMALREKLFGRESRLVARDLRHAGALNRDQKHFAEADSFYNQSLQILNKVAPENDTEKVLVLQFWAQSQNMQARYSDAEKLLLQALAMSEKLYGKDGVETIAFTELLGKNDLDAGKYVEAETRLLAALTKREKLDGPTNPSLGHVLTDLVRCYTEMGNATMAQEIQARLDKIKGKLPGAPPAVLKANPVIAASADIPRSNTPVANKWAVVIGISNFRDSSINLKYGAKDAKDFANFLVTEQNFKPENVKLLIDQDANRMNIADALGEGFLVKNARPDDLVVIFVSSHGGADITKSSGRNFLCSYESNAQNLLMTGITMEWFSQYLTDRVPAQRVVVFLDVCHSGAVTGEKGLSREKNFDVLSAVPGRGQIFIASSLASQLSWESKRYENGVFTHCLMDSLRSNGSQTKLSDAFDRLRKQVEDEVLAERQEMQTPVMKRTWNGDDIKLSEGAGASLVNAGSAPPSAQSAPLPLSTAGTSAPVSQPTYPASQPTVRPATRVPAKAPVPLVPPVPGSQDDF